MATPTTTKKQRPYHNPKYRVAKPLPFELLQNCNIYFEEKLCT